jgi:peptide/nickel transport system substrate-binding protein
MSHAAAAALVCAALVLVGCGEDEDASRDAGLTRPAEGGTLTYALAAEPDELDPLRATGRSSVVVTRQIHEPLVGTLSGPFGDVRELPGLAQLSSSSEDRSIWRFGLRRRVRFQDGTPFNATAVVANARRWIAEGPVSLLPGLVGVDAPRPDLVRFILDRPDPGFPDRLAEPRLGIVSPRALRSQRGEPPTIPPRRLAGGTGTGAFELREREGGSPTVLARNADWWGTPLDLGPALDQVVFPVVASGARRVALLADGEVEVADALSQSQARTVNADPLLLVAGRRSATPIGLERSVRGIGARAGVPILSGAWLTTVGAGS